MHNLTSVARGICFPLLQRRGQRRNHPKGEITAQAFRPGKDTHNELALKGPEKYAYHNAVDERALLALISLLSSGVPSGGVRFGKILGFDYAPTVGSGSRILRLRRSILPLFPRA